MPLHLRPAVEADIDQINDVFFSGFAKDATVSRCFPNKPSVREFLTIGHVRRIADPNVHKVVVVDTDLPDSPVIAYATWVAPHQPNPDEPELPLYPPDGDDLALASFFYPYLKETREKDMAGRTFWHLATLVCHEEHQGRGAGKMLMRYGVEQADKMQADIYVEASPPGVPLYQRFGFKEVGRVTVLDGLHTELFMFRESPSAVA